MGARTREKLIEAARQLFIRKGVENTTISDIASASDKGRRTIYTYFKNKREIYRAVIERESDKMVDELRAVAESPTLTPTQKLGEFLKMRMEPAKITTGTYATLKAMLTIDFGRAEKTRRKAYEKEEALLDGILAEGIATGEFCPEQCDRLRRLMPTLMRGVGMLWSDEDLPKPPADFGANLAAFAIKACGK